MSVPVNSGRVTSNSTVPVPVTESPYAGAGAAIGLPASCTIPPDTTATNHRAVKRRTGSPLI